MSSYLPRSRIKWALFPFLIEYFGPDKVKHETKTEKETDTNQNNSWETGWDRVKQMYRLDEHDNITPELNTILQTGYMSAFMGLMIGGTIEGNKAYAKFMKNNEASKFETPLQAKRQLQDALALGFGKGAYKWGWRLALFSCTFVGLSTTIQVYRNKYGIVEYVSAGALSGIMYKFFMGPKGWVAGGAVGSILGLVCGGCTLGLLKLSGTSMEESRYWRYRWLEGRNKLRLKAENMKYEEEDFAVIKLHDDEVGEAGRTLDNLDKNTGRKAYTEIKE